MKVKVRTPRMVYDEREQELPCYSHLDTGGDDYSAEHWYRHEEKRHVTITEREDYRSGRKSFEVETDIGHGIDSSDGRKFITQQEFAKVMDRAMAFLEKIRNADGSTEK